MNTRRLSPSLITILLASSFALSQTDLGTESQIAAGKTLYDKNCAQCHGEEGNGEGVGADFVKPKPRDFTLGKYKIRTTPTGTLPTDQDIKDIILKGMPYTTMPAWPQFNETELSNLTYYLKSFYSGFSDPSRHEDPIPIPSAPSPSEESIARGRDVYVNLGCIRCHGEQGRGDGMAAREQTDDWGFHLRPADLTKPWTYRGGSERQVVYRTFMTGVNGTPMPSYADPATLPLEDRWPLVDYVFSLSESTDPNYASVVTAVPAMDEVAIEKGVAQFESAPLARFPVVGQIMEQGREFYPSAVDVEVRAVYDEESIALLVEWNDIFAETTGSNDPTLVVPKFDGPAEREEERLGTPVDAVGGEDDLFADDDPFAEDEQQDPFAEDPQAGASTIRPTEFSDAIAIQIPAEIPTGNPKPYFLFGDAQRPVELLFSDLSTAEPQNFIGRGSVSVTEYAAGEPYEFSASYSEGRWSAIFKRERISRRSISFQESQFVPVAFSVWDGFNRERGSKRGVTQWVSLYVEPSEKPSPVMPMVQNSLLVLVLQILVVVGVRRKFAQKSNDSPNQQEATS